MRSILLASALLLTPLPALAQEEDSEVWLTTGASVSVGERTSIDGEFLIRVSDADGLYESEFGAVVTHKLSDSVTISAGYFRVPGYDHGNGTHIDNRPRQQVAVKLGKFLGGSWQARLRTEQRFRSDGDDIGFRLRPQIRYSLPLGGETEFRLSHESYFNLNDTDWGQKDGHERMRNAASIVTPLTDKLNVEVGYLNQYRFGRNGSRDQMDHVLTFALNFDIGPLGGD
jgi:hypothetical protein